jgi:hypothetical protein
MTLNISPEEKKARRRAQIREAQKTYRSNPEHLEKIKAKVTECKLEYKEKYAGRYKEKYGDRYKGRYKGKYGDRYKEKIQAYQERLKFTRALMRIKVD